MISVLLVKDKADELSSGDTKKVTIFLAPKVDLVLQVSLLLICFSSLRVMNPVSLLLRSESLQ